MLIHPFTGGSTKNFTVDEYIKVIKGLNNANPSLQIVITSSYDDMKMAEHVKSSCSNIFVFASSSILELAAVIDKCKVYVGASTGPSHIAGNLCKPSVCIYPNYRVLSPTRWGLYGNNDRTTYIIPDKNIPEKDYNDRTFDNITDEIVNETVKAVLDKLNG